MTTIKKDILLKWLAFAPEDINVEELGKWLENKSSGSYVLVQTKEGDIMGL